MGFFAPCAFTDVTQSDLVIRWDGLEDPKLPPSPVWCLGVDGWKAELSCAHWPESLHMASPSWPPWGSQTFYMEAGGCLQRTTHDLLWPSLKSHIAHLRHVLFVKTVTNPPRFKRRGHGHYLSGKEVSQNLGPFFWNCCKLFTVQPYHPQCFLPLSHPDPDEKSLINPTVIPSSLGFSLLLEGSWRWYRFIRIKWSLSVHLTSSVLQILS